MNDIITVIETLCDKVGIAIDWTSENVVPQIQEVIHRYSMAKIIEHAIGIAVPIVFIIIAIAGIKMLYKAYKNSDDCKQRGYILPESDEYFIPIILLIVAAAIAVVVMVCNGIELSQWAIIPEVKIIEMLNK